MHILSNSQVQMKINADAAADMHAMNTATPWQIWIDKERKILKFGVTVRSDQVRQENQTD